MVDDKRLLLRVVFRDVDALLVVFNTACDRLAVDFNHRISESDGLLKGAGIEDVFLLDVSSVALVLFTIGATQSTALLPMLDSHQDL